MTDTKSCPFDMMKLISLTDLYHKDLPPISYLIDKLICEQSLIYIVGPSGSFKTGYMLYLCMNAITKSKVFDFNVNKPLKTLFIDEENGERRTISKATRIAQGAGIDFDNDIKDNFMILSMSQFKITKLAITHLENIIKQHKPNVIVIDNIARCFVGSERDEHDVAKIQSMLKPLIEDYNLSIIIIHHTRKGDKKYTGHKTMDDISGSRDFAAQCDEAFLLDTYSRKEDTKTFKVVPLKIKDGIEVDSFNFSITGTIDTPLKVEFEGYIKDNVNSLKDEMCNDILRIFFSDDDIVKTKTIQDYYKENKGNRKYVQDALNKLVNDDRILKVQRGEYQRRKLTGVLVDV